MTTTIRQSEASSQFLEEAKVTMGSLRSALLELVDQTGDDFAAPQAVSRRYKLDKTLTWKISRIVRDEEIASSVVHVPGRRRMTSLLAAMREGGANEKSVERVWRAFDDFEKLVRKHSGDRGTLDIMVAGSSQRAPDRRLENLRKAGFQCNSAVWGVRARLHFGIHAMMPSSNPGYLEAFTICGFRGLERLRPGLPWAVGDANSWNNDDTDGLAVTPLHDDGQSLDSPILPDFCSVPVPKLRTTLIDRTNKRFELPEGAVGAGNAVDLTLGWSWPATMSTREKVEGEYGEHGITVSTPVEQVVLDLWMHRSLTFALKPTIQAYSKLPSGPRYPHEGRDVGLLPLPDTVIDLGLGAATSAMVDFPQCREVLQYGMNQRGWNSEEFQGYRYRLKYPPIPMFVSFQHPLLPKLA